MRVGGKYAINFLHLARAQAFGRVNAPDAFEQLLSAQDFVYACNASVEVVRDIEDGCVGVCELGVEGEQFAGYRQVVIVDLLNSRKDFDGTAGPDSPLAKQTTDHSQPDAIEVVDRQKVVDDVVVVARIDCDFTCAAAFRYSSHYVDGLVAVEGGDLDCYYVLDPGKLAPEGVAENATADGRLEIETDYGQDAGNSPGVGDELVFCFVPE